MSGSRSAGDAVDIAGPSIPEDIDRSGHTARAAGHAGSLLSTLIEDVPAGVLVAYGPPQFPIVVVNRTAEVLLACSRDELLGRPAGAHISGFSFLPLNESVAGAQQGLPLYRAAVQGQAVCEEEWSVVRRDGSRRAVLVNTNPLRQSTGEIVGAVTCLRDVTELKRVQDSLREADQRKDQFLAIIAHELRGPLAPARNVVEILKLKASADESLGPLSAVLERQLTDMARLLDDILDLSRVTLGKLRLDLRKTDLIPVIHHALEWTRPAIAARHHRLDVMLPAQPVYVEADAGRLAQVFANLLTNAAKYTEPGGEIALILETTEESALVEVRDTGRGLDAPDMDHLFDLFFQPERTLGAAEGGLGIGLSLVRSLVSLHHGTVRAVSAGRGKGSQFIVRLPLAS